MRVKQVLARFETDMNDMKYIVEARLNWIMRLQS